MKKRTKLHHVLEAVLVFGIFICCLLSGKMAMTVYADEHRFDVEANLLPQDKDTYDIQFTIENLGEDWEGTVRLLLNGSQYDEVYDCSYDTRLSLPQGSTKTYIVRVPKRSVEHIEDPMKLVFLDNRSVITDGKVLNRLLTDGASVLSMGILSDEYSALTYLDMGGRELTFERTDFPIKLKRLDQDHISDMLDKLTFLVIDHYNTSILSGDVLRQIEYWVSAGGILIVGTGSFAEDTLSGLTFLEMECTEVHDPGESLSGQAHGVDLSQLPIAELYDRKNLYNDKNYSQAFTCEWGHGAVGILPYALSELGRLDASAFQNGYTQEDFTEQILDEVSKISDSRYGKSSYTGTVSNDSYVFRRIMNMFGNSGDHLHFGLLEVIVAVYVVFAGPVLYFILRMLQKRELYWIAVPITAVAGIFLVYIAGRGFEVASTRVFSVEVENLTDQNSLTYMHCYDAGYKEWDLQLADAFEFVGPLVEVNYYNRDKNSYYQIKQEGDKLLFGMNPNSAFDDGYFLAGGGKETVKGTIQSQVSCDIQGIEGTVTNETAWDFEYFAVICNDMLFVYRNLPAGGTCVLEQTKKVFNGFGHSRSPIEVYLYDFMNSYYDQERKEDIDMIAALGIAVATAYSGKNSNRTIIVGVTRNWEKAVDDNCSEEAYGCLYAVQ